MVGIGFLGKKICYKRPTFVKEGAVPMGIALFFLFSLEHPRTQSCRFNSYFVLLPYIIYNMYSI
jgi:hypothetical protein